MITKLKCLTNILPASNDERTHFEHCFSILGFSTHKNEIDGQYISELTQAAWLGFCTRENSIRIPERVTKKDTVVDSSKVSVRQPFTGSIESVSASSMISTPPFTNAEEIASINERLNNRSFSTKHSHTSRQEALKKARQLCKEENFPMWVHGSSDAWHITSHGFDVTRRPDIKVSKAQIDELQKKNNFSITSDACQMSPSVVCRLGFTGSIFQQEGRYISIADVIDWIGAQRNPAIFISIPQQHIEGDRKDMLQRIQRDLNDYHKLSSFYRWITRDTVVMAINYDPDNFHPAREQVHNANWIYQSLLWPNTLIFN